MRLGLSAVLVGAVIATTGAPAVLAAPAAPTAGQVTETPAEQARRLNAAGYQAKADAEQAALAAAQATTKDAALTALAAGQTVKNAAAQVKRDVLAFVNAGLPGTTDDDKVTAVQGHAAADVAIERANAAIEVALRKAADNPAERARKINEAAKKAKADAENAALAANQANTKTGALAALRSAWAARDAGAQAHRDVVAFFDDKSPLITSDDRLLVAQSLKPATDAESIADGAIKVATAKV